jgi:hypothetical protein
MARREQEEPFYQRLAEFMVREDKDLWVAATELELGLTSDECERVMRNKAFQRILRSERNKLYNDLANDPARGKTTLVGQAIFSIEKLIEKEQWDKALTGLLSLAKIEGFVGNDTNINVFAGLSSKDVEALRTRLKEKQQGMPETKGNA